MAKKQQTSIKTLRQAQRIIMSTTCLLLSGLAIVFIGWTVGGDAGQLLVGFGSALLFISAVLYWVSITK